MRYTVKVEGLKELDQMLGEFKKATARATLTRVAKGGLKIVQEEAKRLVPVKSGRLRDSIVIGKAPDTEYAARVRASFAAGGTARGVKRTKQNGVTMIVGPSARLTKNRRTGLPTGLYGYALYQEFGTSKMGPHPYMRPAFDQTSGAVLDYVVRELRVQIDATAARLARRAAKLAARG